ncbi:DNA methyltransferase [Helicobacter pylori]
MKLLFLAFVVSFSFSACAKKVIYHEVKVPIKCDIEIPSRPSEHLEALEYLRALLIYTETLENDLKFCAKTNP